MSDRERMGGLRAGRKGWWWLAGGTALAGLLAGTARGQVHGATPSNPPTRPPVLFAGGAVRTDGGLAFSPDGQELVVTLREGPRGTGVRRPLRLMAYRYGGEGWKGPEPVPLPGSFAEAQPSITPDGTRLYFISSRQVPGKEGPAQMPDLWYAERTAGGLGEPRFLAELNTPSYEGFAAAAADGTLYFVSDRDGGQGELDIWRSEPDERGVYQAPVNEAALNSPFADRDLTVDPAERFVVFGRYFEFAASVDLLIAFRRGEGWTVPRPLAAVNDDGWEESPAVTPDGHKLLWTTRGQVREIDLCDVLEAGDPYTCEGGGLAPAAPKPPPAAQLGPSAPAAAARVAASPAPPGAGRIWRR